MCGCPGRQPGCRAGSREWQAARLPGCQGRQPRMAARLPGMVARLPAGQPGCHPGAGKGSFLLTLSAGRASRPAAGRASRLPGGLPGYLPLVPGGLPGCRGWQRGCRGWQRGCPGRQRGCPGRQPGCRAGSREWQPGCRAARPRHSLDAESLTQHRFLYTPELKMENAMENA